MSCYLIFIISNNILRCILPYNNCTLIIMHLHYVMSCFVVISNIFISIILTYKYCVYVKS